VVHDDVFDYLDQARADSGLRHYFDIVYVAPPQYQGLWSKTVLTLEEVPLLSLDGVVVAQIFPKEYSPLPLQRLVLTDQRTYGSTMLCFYEYSSDAPLSAT
jgi:16S rRNA G966 N2-methylase RsmD